VAGSPDPLLPYVPRLVRQWVVDTPKTTWQELDATLVFVDISGFTRLSERLAKQGRIGAEELTEAIGTCFAGLLRVAYDAGGSLLKFGGDALLLLFSGDGHVARGARAAVGMRRSLREVGRIDSSAGRIRLGMSIGIHSGPIHLFLVGGTHRELVVAGPGATQTVTMEGAASAGQILVSPATAAALPVNVLGEPLGPGVLLRRAPAAADEPVEPGTLWADAQVLSCVPLALREHVIADVQEPEHRRVTVAFLKFAGLEDLLIADGPQAASDALDGLVRLVQDAAEHQGVTFLGSDIDAGGGKIILTTGAPSSSGNDDERMLLALQELAAREPPLPLRIGVNTGHVFSGDVGPPYRRAYTVMGDAVNVAARVMSRAEPGDVLATHEVLDASATLFETTPVEPFMVKGKSRPVVASLVGAVRGTRGPAVQTDLPLVGRAEELAAFDAVIAQAREGSGRLVDLVGEAGIGKSRLLEAFRDRAAGFEVHELTCELHRTSTPYGASRKLLRGILGISNDATPTDAGHRLLSILEEQRPDLVEWAPLLAIAFGAELPATETTASLDQQYLRPRLHDAMTGLLAWRWRGPVLVTIEDVQWMDDASTDVLHALAAQLDQRPWVLCVTRREGDRIGSSGSAVTLPLEPLDETATTDLATAATEASPLAAHELSLLVERSGGNPLFLQELVVAALEAGGVDELPDSVETLVTARIDRLARRERSVLRHVSVLGQRFPVGLANDVLPEPLADDDRVWERLGDFLDRDEGALRFRHALIRDVAYGGLRFGLRRELHAKAGEAILASVGEHPEQQAALLSVHFFHAQRFEDAWRFCLAAADQARAVYANAEAAASLERAIEASRRLENLPPAELAGVYERLGDIQNHMGAYRRAVAAYRSARRLLPPDPVDEARLILKQAQQHGWLSKYSQALRWIRRGLHLLDGVDGQAAGAQRAKLRAWYGWFCEEEGRHQLAIRWCHRAIVEAEAASDTEALAHAHRILGRAHGTLGEIDAATTHMARARSLYEEIGDLTGQGAMENNLAALAYWQGRWSEAVALFQQSLTISQRIGDEDCVAAATYNLGHLLCDQGRLEEGELLLHAALRIWQAAGHRASVATAQRDLARAAGRAGRHDEALELLNEAYQAFQEVGARAEDIDRMAVLAECYLLQGAPAQALAVVQEALEANDVLGGVSVSAPLLHRIQGYAYLRAGEPQAARRALDESLAAGRAREMDYEVGLTLIALRELATIGGAAGEGLDATSLTTEGRSLLDGLGVVQIPVVPSDRSVSARPTVPA
jgi:class 3 adenylate cyclase/tetratricopeptide (TPR) repeat protein